MLLPVVVILCLGEKILEKIPPSHINMSVDITIVSVLFLQLFLGEAVSLQTSTDFLVF